MFICLYVIEANVAVFEGNSDTVEARNVCDPLRNIILDPLDGN